MVKNKRKRYNSKMESKEESPRKKTKPTQLFSVMEYIPDLSYPTLCLTWIFISIGFGALYFILSYVAGQHGPTVLGEISNPWYRFLNALYYSIITATSLGYGDIVPQGISKALASIQSIFALFVFAVLVTKLVSHRQEIALADVHRLTFEESFHNIREEFFIVRKDLDRIIHNAEEHKSLAAELWEDIVTALRRCQTLLKEVPHFYGEDYDHYTIDSVREELLLASIHRTLNRINTLLDALSAEGIPWIEQRACVDELCALVHTARTITPLWKEHSPHNQKEAFEELIAL